MGQLKVIKGGAISLLEDLGRFGYQNMGLTTGGSMDEHASRWANRLLNNAADCVVLEVTLGNVELLAESDCVISLCGADMPIHINGKSVMNWSTHRVLQGDHITLGWAKEGMRSYLAVKGGFQIAPEFGSVSTVVRESLGGLNGQPLTSGNLLPFIDEQQPDKSQMNKMVPWYSKPDYSTVPTLRVIAGYQFEHFSSEDIDRFFSSNYEIKADSDRMGFRLSGPVLSSTLAGIMSEGIAYGAIQIPADGQPIILLKDRQTLGGYPKLGTLLPVDAFRLSQARPGSEVRFTSISLESAQDVMREFYEFFSVGASGSGLVSGSDC